MKQLKCIVAALALAACSQPAAVVTDDLAVVDVEGAVAAMDGLRLSDLGDSVRYVPLETNDSCLIGRNPSVQVLDGYILVSSGGNVFSFDGQDGRFVAKIGHRGEDPQAYSSASAYYNEGDGLLYFVRYPDRLQLYDLCGHYRGSLKVPVPPEMPTAYAFSDSLIVGYYANVAQMNAHARALLLFDRAGQGCDTVSSLLPMLPPMGLQDISSISVKKFGNGGMILTRFQDGSVSANLMGSNLWSHVGHVRFKESFCDTIYNVVDNRLQPAVAFRTGRWHFPAGERANGEGSDDKILPMCVLEGTETLFFQCVRGLYADRPETLNGIYNRRTQTTRMAPESEGLADDINGFLPFRHTASTAQGGYASLLLPDDILPWLDEHPEARSNPALAPLSGIGEEDNPVVVIVCRK